MKRHSYTLARMVVLLFGALLISILVSSLQYANPPPPPDLLRELGPLVMGTLALAAISIATGKWLSLTSRIHLGFLLSLLLVARVYSHQKLGGSMLGVSEENSAEVIVLFWLVLIILYTALFAGITHSLSYAVPHWWQAPDPGKCRRCGYDLRGLPEPRCPECGTPFDAAQDSALGRMDIADGSK